MRQPSDLPSDASVGREVIAIPHQVDELMVSAELGNVVRKGKVGAVSIYTERDLRRVNCGLGQLSLKTTPKHFKRSSRETVEKDTKRELKRWEGLRVM